MDGRIRLVARAYEFAELLVLLGMGLGVADHALDLGLRQPAGRLDDDALFLAGFHVLRRNIQNAVGVDVESHLDLRHAARCRRNIREIESAERLVVAGAIALTLQYVDGHARLIVVRGGERLRRLGRDGGVFSITLVMTPPRVSIPRTRESRRATARP